MAITSVDILNLSHSLKDICEVNCNTPECLSQTLKMLLQYNLIQANLQFGRQFGSICEPSANPAVSAPLPASPTQAACPPAGSHSKPCSAPDAPPAAPAPADNVPSPKPPVRLDIADPFLADYERQISEIDRLPHNRT